MPKHQITISSHPPVVKGQNSVIIYPSSKIRQNITL